MEYRRRMQMQLMLPALVLAVLLAQVMSFDVGEPEVLYADGSHPGVFNMADMEVNEDAGFLFLATQQQTPGARGVYRASVSPEQGGASALSFIISPLDGLATTGIAGVAFDPASQVIYYSAYDEASGEQAIFQASMSGLTTGMYWNATGLPDRPTYLYADLKNRMLFWQTNSPASRHIMRAPLAHSQVTSPEVLVTSPDAIGDLAIDRVRGKIYWVRDTTGELMVASMDGTGQSVVRVMPNLGMPEFEFSTLAIDEARGILFWADYRGNAIFSFSPDEPYKEHLVASVTRPGGFSVMQFDGQHLYYGSCPGTVVCPQQVERVRISESCETCPAELCQDWQCASTCDKCCSWIYQHAFCPMFNGDLAIAAAVGAGAVSCIGGALTIYLNLRSCRKQSAKDVEE